MADQWYTTRLTNADPYRRPTLSQRLTELAQRVDFSESVEGEEAEPVTKKAPQKWPWEYTHSKLK